MFKLWGKIWKGRHLIQEAVYKEDSEDTRTHKVLRGLENLCYELDLQVPVWLDSNISEFQRRAKTSFRQDNFIEKIGFDSLEIEIIDE